ncbi:MAG: hypothetical protein EHM70_13220 [Chloroflexota bacterium]|nr:MAG: hypothetical protein EHM70_13220 [Chloroflexota bacterium]
MRPFNKRPQHLFMVRIWYENGQDSEGQLRGSVEHVPTGKRMYFASLNDMADFIAFQTGKRPSPESLASLANGNKDGKETE